MIAMGNRAQAASRRWLLYFFASDSSIRSRRGEAKCSAPVEPKWLSISIRSRASVERPVLTRAALARVGDYGQLAVCAPHLSLCAQSFQCHVGVNAIMRTVPSSNRGLLGCAASVGRVLDAGVAVTRNTRPDSGSSAMVRAPRAVGTSASKW